MLTETNTAANVDALMLTHEDAISVDTAETNNAAEVLLLNGEFLTGEVRKAFIKDNRLVGAVLSFEGRTESALLHIRQMTGDAAADRLADLEIGQNIPVRIVVTVENGERKVWASEKGVEYQSILDALRDTPDVFKNVHGCIHSVTDFGLFIELKESLAAGHRGLLRTGNGKRDVGRVKLGSFIPFNVGQLVLVDLVEGSINDSARLVLRVENVRLGVSAQA